VLPLRGKIINAEKARYDKVLSHNEIRLLISALGTGIGPEEFDVSKLRYHKVILMTDADVDGAHIRTLLLTFFFRHMVQVIEAGHLFIAQPPLFKVKKGRAERYLMSEREMEEFLLEQWVEKTSIKVPGKAAPLRAEALLEALKRVLEFRTLFAKIARRGIPGSILDGLLRKKFRASKRGVGDAEIAAAVAEAAGELPGWAAQLAGGDNGDAGAIQVTGPHVAQFSVDVLKSPDYAQLLDLHADIAGLHKGPCTIVDAAEKETQTKSLDELMRVVMEMAKDGATLQRYKGLGEMNPEQLWETTMNPETRTLLRVTMEDAVGADEMFTVLMGDAVEPRREFIEKNALDVINLDI
jgi:DNA gyrase subunit B